MGATMFDLLTNPDWWKGMAALFGLLMLMFGPGLWADHRANTFLNRRQNQKQREAKRQYRENRRRGVY